MRDENNPYSFRPRSIKKIEIMKMWCVCHFLFLIHVRGHKKLQWAAKIDKVCDNFSSASVDHYFNRYIIIILYINYYILFIYIIIFNKLIYDGLNTQSASPIDVISDK